MSTETITNTVITAEEFELLKAQVQSLKEELEAFKNHKPGRSTAPKEQLKPGEKFKYYRTFKRKPGTEDAKKYIKHLKDNNITFGTLERYEYQGYYILGVK